MTANAFIGLNDAASDPIFSTVDTFGFESDFPDLLAVNDASPTDGASLTQSPTTLGIHFDRPVDPTSLGTDFALTRILPDGSTVPVSLDGAEHVDEADPSWIILTLNQPLAAGNYRLFLSGATGVMGLEGGFYFGDGTDVPLSEFTIEQVGATLDAAIPVGPITSQPTTISGALDFNANPQAVDLYRIDLPATQQLWRLGLEISAERSGSALHSGLSLFDAQGRVIATATIGRKDAPSDPFLFAGLSPGTYYIGVSAQSNLPGSAHGYDPVSGNPGQAITTQPGGAYALSVVADAVQGSTTVIGFQLDHADPIDPTPTGFSIQFSGPIQIGYNGNTANANPRPTLEIVDANGQSYPVAGVHYDEANARLTYLFCAKLPLGLYQVRVPSGGLTDLAGRPPASPGLPAGVLATFKVTPPPNAPDPNDLGVIYPSYNHDLFSRDVTLQPGESVDLRYVLAIQDTTRLTLNYSGTGLGLEIINAQDGSSVTLDPGAPDQLRNALIARDAGTYYLRLTAQGDNAVTAHVALALQGTYFESLLSNGVGQGSAMNLRLITPTLSLTPESADASASPSPAPGTGGLAAIFPVAVTLPPVIPGGSTGGGFGSGQAPVLAPANLFLTVTTSLAGLPSATTSSGSALAAHAAAAGNAVGFGQGQANASGGLDPLLADVDPGLDPSESDADAGPENIAVATNDDPAAPARELTAATGTAALLADSIDALARQLSADRAPSEVLATAEPDPIDLDARLPVPSALRALTRPAGSVELEEARIDPLTIGSILALCAMPFRDRVTRWLRRKAPASAADNSRRQPPSPHHGLSRKSQSVRSARAVNTAATPAPRSIRK